MKCMGDFGENYIVDDGSESEMGLKIPASKERVIAERKARQLAARKKAEIAQKQKRERQLLAQQERMRFRNREPGMIKPSVKSPANIIIEKKDFLENESDCYFSDDIEMKSDKKAKGLISQLSASQNVSAPIISSPVTPIVQSMVASNPQKKKEKKKGFFSNLFSANKKKKKKPVLVTTPASIVNNKKPKKGGILSRFKPQLPKLPKLSKNKKILKSKVVKKQKGMAGNYCMGDF